MCASLEQQIGELPAGLARRHDVVDQQRVTELATTRKIESIAQIPLARPPPQSTLRHRMAHSPNVAYQRQCRAAPHRAAEFLGLIETTV